MQVILRENVPGLGHTGEVINVSAGYARNFLFPRSLAIVASEKSQKELEHNRKVLAVKLAKEKNKYLEVAQKLKGFTVNIKKKAGENERIFGSVTTQEIAVVLKDNGFQIDRKQILLEEPIKKLGVVDVEVKLHPEVITSIKVWVIADETAPAPEEKKAEKKPKKEPKKNKDSETPPQE